MTPTPDDSHFQHCDNPWELIGKEIQVNCKLFDSTILQPAFSDTQ